MNRKREPTAPKTTVGCTERKPVQALPEELQNRSCCSLCGHEEHAEYLADARKATRVDLADVYSVRLKQLLEYHPVMRVLPRRDADPQRFQCATYGRVSKDVVRRRGLLNEPSECMRAHTNSPSACISSLASRKDREKEQRIV